MSNPVPAQGPRVSVCLATRDRGPTIAPTLQSLRHQDHDSFEVIVVDQSADDHSERTFRSTVGADPRFSYIHSQTTGKPAACNLAVSRSRGATLALTDDDCVVPEHWLSSMERQLLCHPRVSAVCAGVAAGAHDPARGFIPTFLPARRRIHTSPWRAYRVQGIGANMAVRASALHQIGGFDEMLGPGAPFGSGTDIDVLTRLLRRGHWILDSPTPVVVHHGFRRWGPQATRRLVAYNLGAGATYAKHLRLFDISFVPSFLIRWFSELHPTNVLRPSAHTGITYFVAVGAGVALSLHYPVDAQHRVYLPPPHPTAEPNPQRLMALAESWRTQATPLARDALRQDRVTAP